MRSATWLLCWTATGALAATSVDTVLTFSQTFSTISGATAGETYIPSSYSFTSVTGQITVLSSSSSSSSSASNNGTLTSSSTTNATTSSNVQITVSSTSQSLTVIGGITSSGSPANATTTISSVSSSTSSSARPTNTVPCNGYPEFCTRKYSNISQVCSHNSAFVVKNNAASNQNLPIMTQLNDGIRMLQGETHWVNDTVYNCHTSCSLLNVGPWQDELVTVREWLEANPYDVVTFLISNSDNVPVENYVPAITNAGLLPYVYTPQYIPQYKNQWPTLGEMILRNQRMVFFMDFNANQTAVPYILEQYTHIWQTPFSPTNQSFPCTIETPPNLNETDAREKYMYLINHNLNVAVDLTALLGANAPSGESTILIPDTANLNLTNGLANQFGRLGAMSNNCTADWGFPPTWMVVDYYEIGSPTEGSVFEVAAQANNVTYNGRCCGTTSTSDASRPRMFNSASGSTLALIAALLFTVYCSL